MQKINPSYLPGIIWFVISTILLTIPGSALPKENWLDKIWFDKWVHTGMFAIMVALWCWGSLKYYSDTKNLKKAFIIFLLIWTGYGIAMEFVQRYFVSNRSFDIGDIAADTIGASIGFIFSWRRYIKK